MMFAYVAIDSCFAEIIKNIPFGTYGLNVALLSMIANILSRGEGAIHIGHDERLRYIC